MAKNSKTFEIFDADKSLIIGAGLAQRSKADPNPKVQVYFNEAYTELDSKQAIDFHLALGDIVRAATEGKPKKIPDNKLLTSHEAAKLIQMDASSVVKWVNDGILPSHRTPGKHRRIEAGVFRKFIKEHEMAMPRELEELAEEK